MNLRAIFGSFALILCGCAIEPVHVETPIEVIGMVTAPQFTGWYKDFCDEGRLMTSLPDCLQHGGEIYRVMVHNVRTLSGTPIAEELIIGFPAHALTKRYRDQKRILLERAPGDFKDATGIEFVAKDWSDT